MRNSFAESAITLLNCCNVRIQLLRPIEDVPGGKDLTSGECSLGQTIPI
jgi:hypothetical protein